MGKKRKIVKLWDQTGPLREVTSPPHQSYQGDTKDEDRGRTRRNKRLKGKRNERKRKGNKKMKSETLESI